MVEMRWVMKWAPLSDGVKKPEKVLQYQFIENMDELGLQSPIWSGWQDVPFVKDSNDD